MAGFRQSILIGNVGKCDPLKYTPQGKAVLNFTIAVNETWGSGEEKQEKTIWHKVALWAQLAESLAPYIVKGKQVMCVGVIDGHAYIDNQGAAACSLDMTAREVRLLGSKGEGSNTDESVQPPVDTKDIPF